MKRNLLHFSGLFLAMLLIFLQIPLMPVVEAEDDVLVESSPTEQLTTNAPGLTEQDEAESNLDNYLITHYDFLGDTQAEQLRDKAPAGNVVENLTLATTKTGDTDDSYIQNGTAFISRKAKNYLKLASPDDLKTLESEFTVYLEFKAFIEDTSLNGTGEVLRIPNTMRVLYSKNQFLNTAIAAGGPGTGPGLGTVKIPSGLDRGWLRVAYTGVYDSATQKINLTIYCSYDGGVTWLTAEKSGVTFTGSLVSGTDALLLGKNTETIADRGISFLYNDVRIYNKVLTQDEIQSVAFQNSPNVFAAGMAPETDLSVKFYVPKTQADQCDSLTASVQHLDRTVELKPDGTEEVSINGKSTMCTVFRYTEVSALTMQEEIEIHLIAQKDGKTWCGESFVTTVAECLTGILNDAVSSEAQKRLCVDALNYGAAAQRYFQYQTDRLANADLSEEQLALGTQGEAEAVSKTQLTGPELPEEAQKASFYGATVNLKNPLELIFKLKAVSAEGLTAVVRDGEGNVLSVVALSEAEYRNGVYCFSVEMEASELRKEFFVTVYDQYGSEAETAVSRTLQYSVESYIAAKLISVDADLCALVKALLHYGDSAAAI